MLVDTHCHYDMFENPKQIINECEREKIITIGMTNLPSHFEMGFPHIKGYKFVRMSLGLHPLMAQKHKTELTRFKKNVSKTSYIGEVGLDFSKDGIATKDVQLRSFQFVLDSIRNQRKIISLHSRKAEKQVLEMLVKNSINIAIFHWYTGGLIVLRQIIEQGYYLSINPSMIKSKSGQKIISEIPLDKVLTETDSPYTTVGNRESKPSDVKSVIDYLSNVHNSSPEIIKNKIYSNFLTLIESIR